MLLDEANWKSRSLTVGALTAAAPVGIPEANPVSEHPAVEGQDPRYPAPSREELLTAFQNQREELQRLFDQWMRRLEEICLKGLSRENSVQEPPESALTDLFPESQLPGQLPVVSAPSRGSLQSSASEPARRDLQIQSAWDSCPKPPTSPRGKRTWTVPDRLKDVDTEDDSPKATSSGNVTPSSPSGLSRRGGKEGTASTPTSPQGKNKWRRSRSTLVEKAEVAPEPHEPKKEKPEKQGLAAFFDRGGTRTQTLSVFPSPSRSDSPPQNGLARMYGDLYARGRNTTGIFLGDMEERVPLWVKYTVGHPAFSSICLIIITANAIFIGAHEQLLLEWELHGPDASQQQACSVIELLFCGFFTVELALRFAAGPKSFVFGSEKQSQRWNFFDTILVLTCLGDIILQRLHSSQAFNYIRILRMLRLARVLRIIRVMRFFRSLRLMVFSILHSMVSLLWVFLLLLSTMYVFSIFFIHSVMEHLKSGYPGSSTLIESFGTLPDAMTSLFLAISGGRDWHEFFATLCETGSFTGYIFVFYIFFVVFGVLNVVTGAFVDSMRLVSEKDHDTVVDAEMKKVDTFRRDVTKMFMDADMDASGTLCWDEFEQHLADERVGAFFRSLQIDTSQARALFLLLDIEESDEVPIEKFVQGCMRMRGDAKSIDVNMLLYETEKMLCKITNFCEFAEDKFELIERELGRIDSVLGIKAGPRLERRQPVFDSDMSHFQRYGDAGASLADDSFKLVRRYSGDRNKLLGAAGGVARKASDTSDLGGEDVEGDGPKVKLKSALKAKQYGSEASEDRRGSFPVSESSQQKD